MGDQNNYKKTWQEKQKEREFEARKAGRKRTARKIGYLALAVAAIAALGWWYAATSVPKGPDLSEAVPVLGRDHVADGTRVNYNSNPPTSGPHYAQPANTGFYSAELPDERLVHNLEHGNIWIAYRPNLPKDAIDALRSFAGGMVIVTPRSANDRDVALAAWGRLDKFDLGGGPLVRQRVKDFILRYQNQGPEKVGVQSHIQ